MRHYNIAFCGLGSIGKRHIRNVSAYLTARGDTFTIDVYRSTSNSQLPDDISALVTASYSFEAGVDEDKMYDAVFVTNPTSVHYLTLKKFKAHTKSFFIEKPVFNNTDIDQAIFSELKDIDCYVACPLRYSPTLVYVKDHIPYQEAIAVKAMSSSYLPDWRPGQDYRKCYSAHRDMGGGVGIDLIHEWDYLSWLWGLPKQCYSIQDKVSQLEIDSDDLAIYIGRNERTTIELHLDYFGRSYVRTLEIFLPTETIRCDLGKGRIEYLKSGKVVELPSERDEYQIREIDHFFKIINHETINDSTAEHAFNVLKIAKGEL